jgi:hypothetical protein
VRGPRQIRVLIHLFLCFWKAEARQQDKLVAQKEIRAIRAAEIERKRNEDEEKERRGGHSASTTVTTSALNKVNTLFYVYRMRARGKRAY